MGKSGHQMSLILAHTRHFLTRVCMWVYYACHPFYIEHIGHPDFEDTTPCYQRRIDTPWRASSDGRRGSWTGKSCLTCEVVPYPGSCLIPRSLPRGRPRPRQRKAKAQLYTKRRRRPQLPPRLHPKTARRLKARQRRQRHSGQGSRGDAAGSATGVRSGATRRGAVRSRTCAPSAVAPIPLRPALTSVCQGRQWSTTAATARPRATAGGPGTARPTRPMLSPAHRPLKPWKQRHRRLLTWLQGPLRRSPHPRTLQPSVTSQPRRSSWTGSHTVSAWRDTVTTSTPYLQWTLA